MKAIIMAGGKGTRMRPLTCELPKPMIPVMNKPVLEYIINLLKQYDINDIAVTLMYLPQKIMDYFGDGSPMGINIKYYIDDTLLGTAGSIKSASEFLNETFLVISGDCITNVNLSEAILYHKKKKAAVTIILKKVDFPLDYGIAITNSDGYITDFYEKPSWGEVFSDTANTGIYIMEPWVLDLVDLKKPSDFSRDIFPQLLKDGIPISGFVTNDYWNDIGGLDSYIRTHHDFFDNNIQFGPIGDTNPQQSWIGENTHIDPTAVIRSPCMIGSNCRIGANVLIDSFTVIGNNCVIENDCSIRRCIIWSNCYVDYASELRGCILGNHVQIMHHVSAFENVVFGDETLIRERTIVKSNIKIWPRKYIEPQSVVDRSVIWANRLSRILFGQRGLSGVINVDMTPEFGTRLGSAYGSIIGKDHTIIISCDHSPSAYLFKLAFLSGLISVGVNAYDMYEMIIPLSRKAVVDYKAQGGVHIMQSIDSTERLQVIFMDQWGVEADKTLEKSIEASYFKEEFRRCASKEIGRISQVTGYCDIYCRFLLQMADRTSVTEAKPKICISSTRASVCDIMERILTEMGCIIVSQNIMESFSPYLLMQEIDSYNAVIGAFIDGHGDKLVIMDETGRIIRDEQLFMLTAYMMMKKIPGTTVFAPNNMTSSLEILTASNNGRIRWTKTGTRSQMKALSEEEEGLFSNPQYWRQYDAISSLAFIIEFLCDTSDTLGSVMENIPSFRVESTSLHCPWENMGKVMRKLIKETGHCNINLSEGIKIVENDSWVLILPDPEQPILQIFAEGKNVRDTSNLLKHYTSRIESFIEEAD